MHGRDLQRIQLERELEMSQPCSFAFSLSIWQQRHLRDSLSVAKVSRILEFFINAHGRDFFLAA